MYSLATAFVASGNESADEIATLRSRCRDAKEHVCNGIDDAPLNLNSGTKSVAQWEELLMGFEDWIFPSRLEDKRHLVNKYAKDRQDERPFVNWVPSRATQRSAKDFMAVIVARS